MTSYLQRYLAGDHLGVWSELRALGQPAPSASASASTPGAPGAVAIPEAVDVLTLPETTEVKGLVLSQVVNPSKKNESCVLLTLAPDGRLARLRTFVTGDGSTPPGSRITPGCTERVRIHP
ncbi:hypothetical protein ACWGB8_24660 [Kitasatospora sp. NPDC054939]